MTMPLGRKAPTDFEHLRKFPLAALAATDRPVGVPCVGGFNWYSDFDRPIKLGSRWWIGMDHKNLGTIRGGHAIAIKSVQRSLIEWWLYYDQTKDDSSSCVGQSESRLMSLLNRRRYDPRWLWHRARMIDEWPENDDLSSDDHGTSLRAGLEILRTVGHVRKGQANPRLPEGIAAYRWLLSVDEVLATIGLSSARRLGALPFLQSWGQSYPHIVWMPGETVDRLLREDGEIATVTDR